jgi:hypothetical protein
MSVTVKTQSELDKALKDGAETIYIESPAGVWLRVTDSGSSRVVARDSSHVVARDSSHVEAWGSSHVVARDSSHVEAWGSSHVEAWGSSHVVARDSSHVVAWGSSHVVARGSSHVVAWGSSHVVAWDSSHVEASKFVAVHRHSQRVTLEGGVVIDLTAIDTHTTDDFLAFHGVTVADGKATVYKAVDADLNAGQGYTLTNYPLGGTVTAPDWKANGACGHGLHFGYRPTVAGGYFNGEGNPRYLECQIDVATMVALGDKVKAPSCVVVREVDRYGRPL